MANAKSPARVLVVEDEALVRLMLTDMLATLGHLVVAQADTIETAVQLAAEGDYEVAFIDLNLGTGMNYQSADIAKSRGKAVVLATGYGASGLEPAYKEWVVLPKPFSMVAVSLALRAAMDSK